MSIKIVKCEDEENEEKFIRRNQQMLNWRFDYSIPTITATAAASAAKRVGYVQCKSAQSTNKGLGEKKRFVFQNKNVSLITNMKCNYSSHNSLFFAFDCFNAHFFFFQYNRTKSRVFE